MVIDTEAYKGRKFKCKQCGFEVSSDAMSDFDVEDFSFCPYCGRTEIESEWHYFRSFLENTIVHFESMQTWSDKDKLNETICAIETEIKRIKDKNLID